MLIGMLISWSVQGRPEYNKTDNFNVVLVMISDIGATTHLQTVFIVCAAVQGCFFVLSLAAERYLRHSGRLPPVNRRREKFLSALSIIFAIIGQIGILLVAVFDTVRHSRVHVSMLCVFLVGIGLSICCTTYEFFWLDKSYREKNRLRVSYFIKSIWLVVAIILAVCFCITWRKASRPVAAGFEWTLAFWYGLYLLILTYDLYPASHTAKGAWLEKSVGVSLTRVASWLPGLQSVEDDNRDVDYTNDDDNASDNDSCRQLQTKFYASEKPKNDLETQMNNTQFGSPEPKVYADDGLYYTYNNVPIAVPTSAIINGHNNAITPASPLYDNENNYAPEVPSPNVGNLVLESRKSQKYRKQPSP
jgi:uncharacterized membrane protein YidH (DUF202 family)